MDAKKKNCSIGREHWEKLCYVKPSIVADKEKSVLLRKTATKGVVRLFNAVKDRQVSTEKSMKKARTMAKQDKVIRSADNKAFYGKLYPSDHESNTEKEVKSEPDDLSSKWEVLRDNFLTSPKLKSFHNWDKNELL
ncbi:RRP15 protein like [Trichuris trichiura]|uniref:RRP15-like protein n=1 Tax=Trichuris trichiura TaxID=36087 RepID=A0A077Z5B2_TRITR|nr:RRP15 protein like [Trichuris trichiura]